MKNIFLLFLVLILGLSSCGTAKQAASDSASVSILSPDGLWVKADTTLEIMPTFQGGDELTFRDWVEIRLKYPENIYDDYIEGRIGEWALQGRVVAGFVVERDGTIKDVEIRSSPHRSYDQVVKDIITGSPAWTPGYKGEKAVRVQYTLPVEFKMDQETLDYYRRRKNARRNSQRR